MKIQFCSPQLAFCHRYLDDGRWYWRSVADAVICNERVLLAAEDSTGQIFGTVQMVPAASENQMHSAQVVKLLVGRSARRRGIGRWLLSAGKDVLDAQHDHKFCCRASLRQRRMAARGYHTGLCARL
ncbi:GNAT family N-acetyltransferase [Bradyrhizobium sp. PMVTL-01]|uniref:GNAT family N-acetyltransferase n=1 Tax=Bradyrhizobium sp. PMVTL-01 TaxID=3434999 RepID=UPI003F72C720